MPAIQPDFLKNQSEELVHYFNTPDKFVLKFKSFLEIFADRSRRPGQAGRPHSKIHSYQVKAPVLKQVVKDLIPEVQKDPETTLELCDRLWEQPNLECRQLCAYLLGSVRINSSDQITDRLSQYINKNTEEILIDLLFSQGLSSFRKEYTEEFLKFIDEWISSDDLFNKKNAIRSLIPLAKEQGITTLPIIFNQIQPLVRNHTIEIYTDLSELIDSLARFSPQETSFFLRRVFNLSDSRDTAMLIRNCLNSFPPEIQNDLREDLRKHRTGSYQ